MSIETLIAQRVEQRIARLVRRIADAHLADVEQPTDALRRTVERNAEAFVIECYAEEIEHRVRKTIL